MISSHLRTESPTAALPIELSLLLATPTELDIRINPAKWGRPILDDSV